jgi:PST family polysaccharide transporter
LFKHISSYVARFTNTEDKKRLLSNFFSLSLLQVANYILPLITLPYLVRVLGPEKFGLVAFAQAFIGYFSILTNYGFNLSATREVSIHRDDKEKVSEIFSSVITIQFFLAILSFIIMTLIVFSFSKFRQDWLLYFFTFGVVAGNVLFPVWFFQGMERMKYITILNITARIIFTIAIFIFVRNESDYLYVPLISVIGLFVAGALGLWIIFKTIGVKYMAPDIQSMKYHLKEGWHIFIGTVGISFYKNNSILILGIFSNPIIVGYFYIAKKIVDVLNQIAGLISQTIYPYISRLINTNYDKTLNFLKKVGLLIFFYTFIFGIILFLFSSNIIEIVSGKFYIESVISLKLMAFVPMFIGVNVPVVQILLSKGLNKQFSNAVLVGAFIDIILNFFLVPFLSYIGSCISVIVTELFVTIYLYITFIRVKKGDIYEH